MKNNTYDIVIIGSGLGGLASGVILAKEGYKVCILEKNNQFGGNLQTFVRDKKIFDTGVHYIGGLAPGENLYHYFKYFGIYDQLKLKKLDENKFDSIVFDNSHIEYPYAQGYDNFVKQLSQYFPNEKKAIRTYVEKIQEICSFFPLYNLSAENSFYPDEILQLNAKAYINSLTSDKTLQGVLAGTNLLYAGIGEKTPFYVHALSVNSYIQSAWRCVNGGSQIAKHLVKEIRALGGKVLKYQEVTEFYIDENKQLKSVVTKEGNNFFAKQFIANIEPKTVVDLIGKQHIRKAYYKRVKAQQNGISAFSLYLVLKPKSIRYKNYNTYYINSPENVWTTQNHTKASWPEAYMFAMSEDAKNKGFADTITAIAYMSFDEVKNWENSFNTVAEENERGQSYDEFKNEKAQVFIKKLAKKLPGLEEAILSIHTSTPLSYRDYIGSYEGSMYGYEKDANQPMKSFLSAKTKIPNLFLTGQSINMHGILGVTISAVITCSEIVGMKYLVDKIKKEVEVDAK
ncbi:NAD(P)/FAD-dependent oxidoreductase [Mesonia sp. K7]|uniref:phytoene desaturase family protein n=1 Tax=Mesonia sp. K7 TaxID=2218606 RepID=UPI000DA7A0C7|nr:NAD(P)/FAD-dependent oxidoreductase [Mesonia sp. K7]PZD76835.1 all-trans-retinol 13,14-reductase [Mesonia sp. K7]